MQPEVKMINKFTKRSKDLLIEINSDLLKKEYASL